MAAQDHIEILRLRGILRMQADRIAELRDDLVMEQERVNALREQLHEVEASGVEALGEGVTPSPSHGGESVGSVRN